MFKYSNLEIESIMRFFEVQVKNMLSHVSQLSHFNNLILDEQKEYLDEVFIELIAEDMRFYLFRDLISEKEIISLIFMMRNIFISMVEAKFKDLSPQCMPISKDDIINWVSKRIDIGYYSYGFQFCLEFEEAVENFKDVNANEREFYYLPSITFSVESREAEDNYQQNYSTKEKYLDYNMDIDDISDLEFEKLRERAFNNIEKLKNYSQKLRKYGEDNK